MRNRSIQVAYFYSLAGVGFVTLAGITTGILSSRILAAKGRGELTALLLLPGLVGQVGNLGLCQAVGYLDNPVRKRPEPVAGAALVVGLGIGCMLCLCLLPFLSLLLPNLPEDLRLAAALCMLYIPLNFVYSAMRGADIAEGRFRSYNLIHVAVGASQVVLMLIFWRVGQASASTFGMAVVLAVLAVLLARALVLKRLLSAAEISFDSMRRVLSKAWDFTQPELAGLALVRFDVLLLARMVSNEALGLYTVALAVAFGQALMANPLAQVCFHSTSSASDHSGAMAALARQLRVLQIIFLAVGGVVAAITPTLIRVAFGPRFSTSARPAMILIVSMVLWECSQILEGGMRGMNLARLASWSNVFGLILLVPSSLWLTRALGIEGMALATVIAQSASLAAKLFLLRRATGCAIGDFSAFTRSGLEEFSRIAKQQARHLMHHRRERQVEVLR